MQTTSYGLSAIGQSQAFRRELSELRLALAQAVEDSRRARVGLGRHRVHDDAWLRPDVDDQLTVGTDLTLRPYQYCGTHTHADTHQRLCYALTVEYATGGPSRWIGRVELPGLCLHELIVGFVPADADRVRTEQAALSALLGEIDRMNPADLACDQ